MKLSGFFSKTFLLMILILPGFLMFFGVVTVWAEASESKTEDWQIIDLQIKGTEQKLLPDEFDGWSCDWTADGKAIVFAGKERKEGEIDAKIHIWYWNYQSDSKPIQLTYTENMAESNPRWSPRERKILLTRRICDNGVFSSSIWSKDLSTGNGQELSSGQADREAFWAPDGQKIVFGRGINPYRGKLFIKDFLSNSVKEVFVAPNVLLRNPWWGIDDLIYFVKSIPGRKKVSFSGKEYWVTDFGQGSIWAYNPEDEMVFPVINDQYDNRLPALSPDGTKLAFVSNRPFGDMKHGKYDRGSLYIKDLLLGKIYFVTNKVSINGGSLSWSPDGSKLAFVTFRSIRPAVWVIDFPKNF